MQKAAKAPRHSAPRFWRAAVLLLIFLRRNGALGLTLGVGALLSFGWFSASRDWERRSLENETRNLIIERVELLRGKLLGSLEVLESVAAFDAARSGNISREEFRAFVVSALARHQEIQALSWNPVVPAAERAGREAAMRRDGLSDFCFRELNARGEMVPAGARDHYVPVYFEQPVAGNEPSFGFDLASDPGRRETLARACDSGGPAATPLLRLVQERGDQLGFLVLYPLYRGVNRTLEERRAHTAGFASAVFRLGDLVEQAWENVQPLDLDLAIRDSTGSHVFFRSAASEASSPASADAPRWIETLDFPGGAWEIVFRPTPRFLAAHAPSRQPWIGLGAGLLITLLVAGYLLRARRRSAQIERRVQARTAQLSAEVAERQRVEKALREAELKYRSIFENSIEGIFQTTPGGTYLRANPELARLYGYVSAEELIADLAEIDRRLYVEPGRRAEFIRRVQENNSVSDFESQVRRKDGRVIWISEKARVVRDEHGAVLYYEGVVDDITARKRADETLRTSHDALETRVAERTVELARANEALRAEVAERQRAEMAAAAANAAKSEFLAHMSHEIRTPLNAILGYAQILHADGTLPAAHRPAVETIGSSGYHLLELIDDVLDLSKIEAGCMELQTAPFDLRALVRRLETMFAQQSREKGLTLKIHAADLPARSVVGDAGKLRQALINLLGNAVKFTDTGEVGVSVTPCGEAAAARRYRFEVSDTGIGIAPAMQAAIFEPFQQAEGGRRNGGTGLGLAIARSQIELMGGKLALDSTPGVGTRFFFELALPFAAETPTAFAVESARPLRLADGAAIRALVVDDVAENRDVLAGMLAALGCQARTAAGGADALAAVARARPDVVFLDIWLPGDDGIAVARQMRATCGAEVLLVAHSASTFDGDRRRFLQAGFDDFLAKPFRRERIIECLASLLPAASALPSLDAVIYSHAQTEILPHDFDACRLPDELFARVQTAAELHSLTELKKCTAEIARTGLAGEQLARQFHRWLAQCDIGAILAFLDRESRRFSSTEAMRA
ncbi:MAG: CHASE domain-containing protein [Verrucomicrobia bacterium]|nr:CHASE domain-containing protein [Verrucomicrobiota bacterium]